MANFSTRFKKLRLERELTQEELRADFNKKFHRSYTATAISQYENGRRMPEIDALQDFANYFGVSVSYLIGEIETRNPDISDKIEDLPTEKQRAGEAIYNKLVEIGFIKAGDSISDEHLAVLRDILAPQVDFARFKLNSSK